MPNQSTVKSNKSKLPPKGWRKKHPINSYQSPPPSRFRRILRFFVNPLTITLTLLVMLGAFLTLTYFWFDYSERIDRRLLSGQVYTPSAGIYSAPKNLQSGEKTSLEDLTNYLKTAGYIDQNIQADESRSRYKIEKNQIEINPGLTGTIDDKKVFPAVVVKFDKENKAVAGITEKETERELKQVQLEPKILSSLAEEGDGRRKTVTFNDLPENLVKAITVTEDRSFFEHYGVNLRGIARAAWRRYEGNEDSPLANQGGSSITQQLVKNLLLTREQTLTRKLTEAYMSIILETRLNKEEIFTLYANQIYLGQQSGVSIYGVGEASNAYFGKDVAQLTLAESAFLAGIIRSPNRYNPYKNVERVTERRNQVLDSMREADKISDKQLSEARASKLELYQVAAKKDLQGMPYFSQYAVEELPKIVSDPEAVKHLRVYTTIDPDLQKAAYEIVNKRIESLGKYFPKTKGNLNAALVAIRPKTGEIVAMVGGKNYLENQFNRATDAMRQPGSVFKPFVYAAAINSYYDSGSAIFTTASIFKDEKKVFTFNQDSYAPNNYGDVFSGKEVTLRDALVKSKNTITVDLAMQLNVGKVMNLATKAGLPKVEKAYPSMALGTAEATPLQIATGYTAFANLGDRVLPMPIRQITNGEGKTIVVPTPDKKNVFRPDVAYIANDMMKDVITRGTAAEARAWGFQNANGKAFAGKTGTSRDGWFVGFTPELVCVVYVGFDDGSDLGMKGSDSAMPIWADFMRDALERHPEWNGDWQMPSTIRKGEIDIRNGKLIRELDSVIAQVTPTPTPTMPIDADLPLTETPEVKEIYVTDVPPEFRRVEIFIGGTIPMKALIPTEETNIEETSEPNPAPSGTPFTTWAEEVQPNSNSAPKTSRSDEPKDSPPRTVTVAVCDLTGQRATSNCPNKRAESFEAGSEPKDFCKFHVSSPKE